VLKLDDDPVVNESEIVVFLRQVWWAAGKERVLGEEKGKNENEEKKEAPISVKTDLTLFIARFNLFIYLLFYKNKLYFILYQTNK